VKVLVTGATGFTGRHLCERLTGEGATVVAFVRPTSDTRQLERLGIECRIVDIRDREDVDRHFETFEQVYHLAAAFRTEHSDPEEFRRVNVDATRHLLAAAFRNRTGRFIHCSTVGVQGEIRDVPAAETYRYAPGDSYQRTKMEGELAALESATEGHPVTVVRPVGIYGPGDTRFLKLFRAIARRRFAMIGSGRTLYHLTYIDDLVQGLWLAGTKPEAIGQVFTIGGERYTTLRELVDLIADTLKVKRPRGRLPYAPVYVACVVCERVCRVLGIDPPLYPRRVEFFAKDRGFDIGKAKRVLGYAPGVTLEAGIGKTAAWYRAEGLL
jgi:nucleoside-diphosphate-sugar epimerase